MKYGCMCINIFVAMSMSIVYKLKLCRYGTSIAEASMSINKECVVRHIKRVECEQLFTKAHTQRVHYVLGHEIMYTVTGAYCHRCIYNLLSLKLSK